MLDDGPPLDVVDAVAVCDGAPGDTTYGGTVLDAGDGTSATRARAARRASPTASTPTRRPTGCATTSTSPASRTSPARRLGEALNTPGAANARSSRSGEDLCDAPIVTIGSVQGSGTASPVAGDRRRRGRRDRRLPGWAGLDGYYLQDSGDGDPRRPTASSSTRPGGPEVPRATACTSAGAVSEFNGLTEITATTPRSARRAPHPRRVELSCRRPTRRASRSRACACVPQSLTILEYFSTPGSARSSLGLGRQFQPTAVVEPGSRAHRARREQLEERITLDDGRSVQNPDPPSTRTASRSR